MKEVKFFDVYSNGKIIKYCVSSTKEYKDMIKILKHSDKDAVVTYIEFDDGTNGLTNEWYDLFKMKIDDSFINRTQQSNEKALADFRALSNCDKYQECVRYGSIISSVDANTTVGWLTIRIIEIYDKKFLFVLVSGDVQGCYELQ